MLAPHLKKKIDKLWNKFWAAGITNPLVAVEQITYLIFLRRLEDIDHKRTTANPELASIYDGHETCKWSYIRLQSNDVPHLINVVFPWLRQLDTKLANSGVEGSELDGLDKRMADAYFQLDPKKGQTLAETIGLIDELFARSGEGSAAQDVMGDTFEYLLGEIATAGTNGQFRTPRHLIRFMVELLDPKPGDRIIDPAAGTGGFLFSAQQYLMRKYTDPDTLRLEWDGAPHRTDGAGAQHERFEVTEGGKKVKRTGYELIHDGRYFVGLDNDRTMARIGWMNLVLHGLENPHIFQGDSLSKRKGKDQLEELLRPGSYQCVLANPPFTGTVDDEDLEGDPVLFPRVGGKGKKANDAITNKSELLFCWLMLDLLDVGGRCAVIVPEGVLFGNTEAHLKLRRELLTDHIVEAVISLPGGIFQPYTGVKTSILVFRKVTTRDHKSTAPGTRPTTERVWFYEVKEDGYSLDAKRTPRDSGPLERLRNDLWDALAKFRAWSANQASDSKAYYAPQYERQRWRLVQMIDEKGEKSPFNNAFGHIPEMAEFEGGIWSIRELFSDLPEAPDAAEIEVRNTQHQRLREVLLGYMAPFTQPLWEAACADHATGRFDSDKAVQDWDKTVREPLQQFRSACREIQQRFFETEDSLALELWKSVIKDTLNVVPDYHRIMIQRAPETRWPDYPTQDSLKAELEDIAREFAKLDGFNVTLRSVAMTAASEALGSAKHWVVEVRQYLRNDDWASGDGKIKGSHDAKGNLRPEYVRYWETVGLYDDKGNLKDDILDPDCIEGREWNLAAGQYKPFDFEQLRSEKSAAQLIRDMQGQEELIVSGLKRLLKLVEGK